MEEERELVTCIIKRQNIEENPCREGDSTGPISPQPIKNLPIHQTGFLFVPLVKKVESPSGKRWLEGDPSGIFPINPLPLVSFLK